MTSYPLSDDSTFLTQRRLYFLLPAGVFLAAALYTIGGTLDRNARGDTTYSRLATVNALTTRGTFYLADDDPFLRRTVDKIYVDGQYMSSKPPVLPLLMTAQYLVVRAVTGWSLDNPEDLRSLVDVFTLTFVGLPFLLMVGLVWRIGTWFLESNFARAFLMGALAFGTQAGGYATVFNNHVLPASMLTACMYIAIDLFLRKAPPTPLRMMMLGVVSSLAVTIDMPSVFFVAPLSVAVLLRYPREALLWAAPIALVPIVVQTIVYLRYTGSPLPVQTNPEWYRFETSYWRVPRGSDALAEPRLLYLFHMTFGRNGIFMLFPVTLLGLAGAWNALRRADTGLGVVVGSALLGFLLLTAYYGLTTNNYGGSAFGFRWYIIASPVLLLGAIPVLKRLHRPVHWVVPAVLAAVSVFSTAQCVLHPWTADAEWTVHLFGPRT